MNARIIRNYIITLMVLFLPMVSMMAGNAEEAANRLAALGFENVRVAEQGDQLAIVARFVVLPSVWRNWVSCIRMRPPSK